MYRIEGKRKLVKKTKKEIKKSSKGWKMENKRGICTTKVNVKLQNVTFQRKTPSFSFFTYCILIYEPLSKNNNLVINKENIILTHPTIPSRSSTIRLF